MKNKGKIKQYLLLIAFGVMLFWLLNNYARVFDLAGNILSILSPVIIGFCIAFCLDVPLKAFEGRFFKPPKKENKFSKFKMKIKRPVSIFFVLLVFFLILFMIFYLVIPAFIETLNQLTVEIPGFVEQLSVKINEQEILTNWLGKFDFSKESVADKLTSILKDSVLTLKTLDSTISVVSSIFSSIVNAFLGLFFAIYMLAQKEKLLSQWKKLLYAFVKDSIAEKITYVCKKSSDTFSKFLTGQCLEAVILGTLCAVGMMIMRMPYALMIGVLVAVTAFIPIVGAFIGVAVGAFLISVTSLSQAFWFIVFMLVLQQIEGNFIYPHVVGSSVGLPSIWVLFAVTVGGNIGGLMGMFVSVPICAVIYSVLSDIVYFMQQRKKPVPEPEKQRVVVGQEKSEPKDNDQTDNIDAPQGTKSSS